MSSEMDEGLRALEALEKKRGRPTRHDARPVLLALGRGLADGEEEALQAVKRRLAGFPTAFLEAWSAAVRDEISMAATEHVSSADPRYLAHPRYDWEYTLEARARLGWRLRAVQFLGITVDPATLSGIERADRTLASRRPNP
jgi:hypothetical protein